jgi:vacuolar-type H+-ATPase subunit I/STV1
MASANDDVAAALEEALASPKEVETQSTTDLSPEVKPAAAPSDTKVESTKETDSKSESKTVPYDRFSEVVSQKNDAFDKVKSLEGMFQGATEREDTLRTRVGELESEHQILDAIRNLAGDERYRTHVMAIDKALQGIEEEVVEAKAEGDDQKVVAAEKRFSDKAAELEDLISEQNAESLWSASDATASQMLKALPEEYTDVDKQRLSQLWTPRVNWDHIEENGRDAITPTLQASFAELIKDYGPPQGAVAKQTREEILKDVPEAANAGQTPDQKVASLLGQDWAATGEDGKAVTSDAEFSQGMADLMKATRTSS